jgi:hypothetical protein
MINVLGEDKSPISDNESLVTVYNEKNNIFWREAYYECDGERFFIISYFYEGQVKIKFMPDYIVVFTGKCNENGRYIISVRKIFDMKNKALIPGSSEELQGFYLDNILNQVPEDNPRRF